MNLKEKLRLLSEDVELLSFNIFTNDPNRYVGIDGYLTLNNLKLLVSILEDNEVFEEAMEQMRNKKYGY